MDENKKQYRILIDYGSEGWSFWNEQFETAKEALEYAMEMSIGSSGFKIVKVIEFVERE